MRSTVQRRRGFPPSDAVEIPAPPPDGPPASRRARRGAALVAVAYLGFAAVAAAINLGTQQLVISALPGTAPLALQASVVAGTLTGFAAKYLLDKAFIFADVRGDGREEVRKVALYGGFAVLTTALFWLAEFGAFYAFGTAEAKYAGAAAGLAAGYAMKFQLDRRYTFRR